MAKTLTPEQREAANKRKRDRRAALKAAGVPNAEAVAEAIELVPDPETLVFMKKEVANDREAVLAAKEGAFVTAPRGGMPGYVNKTFRGGGRFVTSDGEGVYGAMCKHTDEQRATRGETVYFEQVGDGNRDWTDGGHGWAHRFSRCNKVFQIG